MSYYHDPRYWTHRGQYYQSHYNPQYYPSQTPSQQMYDAGMARHQGIQDPGLLLGSMGFGLFRYLAMRRMFGW